MKICSNCTFQFLDKYKFCPKCQAKYIPWYQESWAKIMGITLLIIFVWKTCNEQKIDHTSSGTNSNITTNTNIVSNTAIFYARDYGDKWPFNVDQITVFCTGTTEVYFEANGVNYALNGTARDKTQNGEGAVPARDMEEIRLADSEFPGSTMSIPMEFTSAGLNLCQ